MAEDKRPPFLSEFRVQDNTQLVADILALARAMRNTPEIWAIFERVTDRLEITDQETVALGRFESDFFVKLGKKRPVDASLSATVLRQLAAGKFISLDCESALDFLKKTCHFN